MGKLMMIAIALTACSTPTTIAIEPEPTCTTYLVSQHGDTLAIPDYTGPNPHSLPTVVEAWEVCE